MQIRVAIEADIPEMHRIRMSVRENRLANASVGQPRDYRAMLTSTAPAGWPSPAAGSSASR